MAFNFKNNETEIKEGRAVIDLALTEASVERVRQIAPSCIVFTLKCKGFSFYDMRVCEDKDGKSFVTVPKDKGTDGRYYARYAVYLSKSDQESIIKKVFGILNNVEDVPFEEK